MPDILELISDADRLDFSQNISVARPAYLGDRLFPDQKTESLKAEYLRLANGAQIPTMATVHAFDTEAEIATRPALEKTEVEKLFIKRKINQSERVQLLNENGVYADNAIVSYVFDDMRLMADAVKVRTEVAKMEVIATGKMTIKENNLNMTVDYGVPSANTGFKIDFGADADIVGQLQAIADQAAASGHALSEMVVGTKILRKLASNKGIQTLVYGTVGAGTYVTTEKLRSLFTELFGFGQITTNDQRYKAQAANDAEKTHRFFPEDKVAFLSNGTANSFGVGLWGVTPEEKGYGPYTDKSAQQYITITQWETPDPKTTWTKASGLFIPVVPDPYGLFIGADVSK